MKQQMYFEAKGKKLPGALEKCFLMFARRVKETKEVASLYSSRQ